MPTFQFFKDGEKVDAMEGADAGKIESILLALGAAERRILDPDEDGTDKTPRRQEDGVEKVKKCERTVIMRVASFRCT